MIPRDLEPHFRQRLPGGIILATGQFESAVRSAAFHNLCVKRFIEGDLEHGRRREWIFDWPLPRFEGESVEEIADHCDYWTMYLMAQDFREAR